MNNLQDILAFIRPNASYSICGNEIINYEGEDPPTKQELFEGEKLLEKSKESKKIYSEMVEDIYNEMLNVFGTKNDASAQASVATYEAMANRPENYVGQLGLVSVEDVVEFSKAKLVKADEYGIFRMNRIEKFKVEVAALSKPTNEGNE